MIPASARPRWHSWPFLLLADGLALLMALALALLLLSVFRHERIGGDFVQWWRIEGEMQSLAFVLLSLFCCIRFWLQGHYELRLPYWDELREVLQVLLAAALLNVMVVVLLHGSVSRFLWPISWLLVLCLVPTARGLARMLLARHGQWELPTLILGSGTNAVAACQALHSEARLGFAVKAFVQVRPSSQRAVLPAPVLVLQEDQFLAQLEEQGSVHLVVALEADEMESHAVLLERLALQQRDLYLVPSLSGLPLVGLVPCHFFRQEILMLALHNNLGSFPRRFLKRAFDLSGAVAGLLLLAPLLLALAWGIRRDGAPALYAQRRVGRGGREFNCLKFRTMVADSDALLERLLQSDAAVRDEWHSTRKLRHDPRITAIGAFLRRSSLDELPQLWNVVRGDMSLVGPRPVVPSELERYGSKAGLYLQVRPGMSGLWQVSGRNDTSYAERIALDAWYIKNWSLWYDIAIVCKTVRVVLGRKGAY